MGYYFVICIIKDVIFYTNEPHILIEYFCEIRPKVYTYKTFRT
jgi:hypothetical protein